MATTLEEVGAVVPHHRLDVPEHIARREISELTMDGHDSFPCEASGTTVHVHLVRSAASYVWHVQMEPRLSLREGLCRGPPESNEYLDFIGGLRYDLFPGTLGSLSLDIDRLFLGPHDGRCRSPWQWQYEAPKDYFDVTCRAHLTIPQPTPRSPSLLEIAHEGLDVFGHSHPVHIKLRYALLQSSRPARRRTNHTIESSSS